MIRRLLLKKLKLTELETRNKENTARRQALAIYYIDTHLTLNKSGDISLIRFIQFLTDKNLHTVKDAFGIPRKFSEYKSSKEAEALISDLQYIRIRFEDLKLSAIIKQIDLDIETVSKNIQ